VSLVSNTGPLIALAKVDLLRPKQEGLISSVREVLEQMRGHGYWLSDELIEVATKLAGET